jgi:hypothetical protein
MLHAQEGHTGSSLAHWQVGSLSAAQASCIIYSPQNTSRVEPLASSPPAGTRKCTLHLLHLTRHPAQHVSVCSKDMHTQSSCGGGHPSPALCGPLAAVRAWRHIASIRLPASLTRLDATSSAPESRTTAAAVQTW